jgi:hypothetical protein
MVEKKESVPFEEAYEQVRSAMSRLALMHLAFSKVLVDEFGDEKGKELIIKSIMEYGRKIEEYSKLTDQEPPYYGMHGKYIYKDKEFVDIRDIFRIKDFDLSSLEIYDCSLAKVFNSLKEKDIGKLYCYIDAARAMASNPENKTIHTKCILCDDEFCQIIVEKTTEKERSDFKNNEKDWNYVDKILL